MDGDIASVLTERVRVDDDGFSKDEAVVQTKQSQTSAALVKRYKKVCVQNVDEKNNPSTAF